MSTQASAQHRWLVRDCSPEHRSGELIARGLQTPVTDNWFDALQIVVRHFGHSDLRGYNARHVFWHIAAEAPYDIAERRVLRRAQLLLDAGADLFRGMFTAFGGRQLFALSTLAEQMANSSCQPTRCRAIPKTVLATGYYTLAEALDVWAYHALKARK